MSAVNYLWNPLNDNIVREFDDAGAVIAEYTTESNQFGNVVSQRRNGQDSVHHYDGQGSTLALTDATGNVTDTYAYTAFGEVTAHTGGTVNPFQYVGQKGFYRDAETGEYHYRARIYDPIAGRYCSKDRIGLEDSRGNPFVFVAIGPSWAQTVLSISDCLATGNNRDCSGCCVKVPKDKQAQCLWECANVLPTLKLPGCKLEVCCRPVVPIVLSGAHCVIRFTDIPSGKVSGCRGGPSGIGAGSKGNKGGQPKLCGCCGGFGSVVTACGTGRPGGDDKAEIGLYLDLAAAEKGGCMPVSLSPRECLKVKSCIEKEMQEIEDECWIYNPAGNNSNTTWRTAMQRCTGSVPDPPGSQPGNGTFDEFEKSDPSFQSGRCHLLKQRNRF